MCVLNEELPYFHHVVLWYLDQLLPTVSGNELGKCSKVSHDSGGQVIAKSWEPSTTPDVADACGDDGDCVESSGGNNMMQANGVTKPPSMVQQPAGAEGSDEESPCEDLVDGFAILSYSSYEQLVAAVKASEETNPDSPAQVGNEALETACTARNNVSKGVKTQMLTTVTRKRQKTDCNRRK